MDSSASKSSGSLSSLPNIGYYIFLTNRSLAATALAYRFKSNSLSCHHSDLFGPLWSRSPAQPGMVT